MSPFCDAGNPFSTRHVRPGAIAYLFPDGENVDGVIGRLAAAGWRGQIVGPHGSGKSSLLASLLPAIEATGRHVVLVELHDGERRLPVDAAWWGSLRSTERTATAATTAATTVLVRASTHPTHVLVIDGYEQLPWWRRWAIQRKCRRLGVGLLVTSHRSVGLPEVHRTQVDAELGRRVVAQLLAGRSEVLSREEVDECVRRHGQDLREALFELYDVYERRRG